jgi:hypothetical protein
MVGRLLLASGIVPFLLASPALARDARPIARAGDIERPCAGVAPGKCRIRACVKTHITGLSAPCINTLLMVVAWENEPQ